MDAAAIITAAQTQVGADSSRAVLLTMLNEVYATQVAESRWYRTELALGNTVAGTGEYTIPASVIEAYGVDVGGYPYLAIGEDVLRRVRNGSATIRVGREGVFAPGFDSSGNTTITLWPTPSVTGTAIVLYAAVQPAALTDSGASVPITPADTHSSLIDGLAALVLSRVDERPDLAGPHDARFATSVEKLRRRRNGLAWGSQPVSFAIKGYHF